MKSKTVVYRLDYYVGDINQDQRSWLRRSAFIDDYDIVLRLYDHVAIRDDVVFCELRKLYQDNGITLKYFVKWPDE